MILIDEPTASARVSLFMLPSVADPRVPIDPGHVFTAGEVRVRYPGAAYADASSIVEYGHGAFGVRHSRAQVQTGGLLYLYASVAGAQPYSAAELIASTVIGHDELSFHLSDVNDPSIPVAGASFAGATIELCLPGGVFTAISASQIVERGYGDYAVVLTTAQKSARGKAILYVAATGAQTWIDWYDLAGAGVVVASTAGADADAEEAIIQRWLDVWPSLQPAVPFTFDNEGFTAVDTWARVTLVDTVREQESQGAAGSRRFGNRGRIFVQLFGTVGVGSRALNILSADVRKVYESVRIGEITTYAGSPARLASDGTWAMRTLSFRYWYPEQG